MQRFISYFIVFIFSYLLSINFSGCNSKDTKKTETKPEKLFSELDSNENKDTNISTIPMKISSKNFKFLKKDNTDSISMKIQLNQLTTLIDLIDWYLKQGNAAGGPGKISTQDLDEVLKAFNSGLSDYNLEKMAFYDLVNIFTKSPDPSEKPYVVIVPPDEITYESKFKNLKVFPSTLSHIVRHEIRDYLLNKGSKAPDIGTSYEKFGELVKEVFKKLKGIK